MSNEENSGLELADVVASFAEDVDFGQDFENKAPVKDTEEVKEEPAAEATPEEASEEVTESQEDDDVYLLDDDELGSDDSPEETTEETKEEVESDDDGQDIIHKFKADGEEIEISQSELYKNYGRGKSLTRKEQDIAEQRKRLDEESKTVAWANQKPEVRELNGQIVEAQEAINRGFVFDSEGNQKRLSQSQIEETKKNVEEAQKKMSEMAIPPRLDDLRAAVPGIFDPAKEAETLKPFEAVFDEFGYSQAEKIALNDPRIFLMTKELLELRDLQARVERAKANRSKKNDIVNRPTTKPKGNNPVPSKTSKPKKSDADIMKAINNGEATPADLFGDIDF